MKLGAVLEFDFAPNVDLTFAERGRLFKDVMNVPLCDFLAILRALQYHTKVKNYKAAFVIEGECEKPTMIMRLDARGLIGETFTMPDGREWPAPAAKEERSEV